MGSRLTPPALLYENYYSVTNNIPLVSWIGLYTYKWPCKEEGIHTIDALVFQPWKYRGINRICATIWETSSRTFQDSTSEITIFQAVVNNVCVIGGKTPGLCDILEAFFLWFSVIWEHVLTKFPVFFRAVYNY